MKKTSYKPYSGNDKYIFASYSHLDSAIVIPIIKRIQSKGYRIWYDEKIDPGHFWLGKIANQIYACEVFLIFISPNTVKSSYCKDELAYARSKEKPIFCIMLQKTLLEPESEFLLTRFQHIQKYNYSDEHEFYRKLFSSTLLLSCKNIDWSPRSKGSRPYKYSADSNKTDPATNADAVNTANNTSLSDFHKTRQANEQFNYKPTVLRPLFVIALCICLCLFLWLDPIEREEKNTKLYPSVSQLHQNHPFLTIRLQQIVSPLR